MSLDANELVRLVKQAAVDAVLAQTPVGVCYGTVVSAAPLKIQVDQKQVLGTAQLILTDAVRDYTVSMTVDHRTEVVSHGHAVTDTYTGGGSAIPMEHDHPYRGQKEFLIHNALKTGENVILLRCDGGQKYIVLGRWGGRA